MHLNSKNILMVLLSIISVIQSSQLKIDLQHTVIQSNKEWTRVKLGVKGGEPPYRIFYDEYPRGWKQVLNQLYTSQKNIKRPQKYPCKVRIEDNIGRSSSFTVVFISQNQSLSIEKEIYNYDKQFNMSFFNSSGLYGRPEMEKNELNIMELQSKQQQQKLKQAEQIDFNFMLQQKLQQKQRKLAPNNSINEQKSSGKNFFRKWGKQFIVQQNKSNLITELNLQTDENMSERNQQLIELPLEVVFSNLEMPSKPKPKPDFNVTVYMQSLQNKISAKTNHNQAKQGIFSKLPSTHELDQIIFAADSFAILKTLQLTLNNKELNCEQKYLYLSDFLGRIHSAIQMKKFATSQLQVIIVITKQQIRRLQNEIRSSETEIYFLNIKQLRDSLSKELLRLQEKYNRFNEIQTMYAPAHAKIQGYKENIRIIYQRSDQNRAKVQLQKLKLTEIESEVEVLQRKLAEAKLSERKSKNLLNSIQKKITADQQEIKNSFKFIESIEQDINNLQRESDRVKILYSILQIKVDRLKGDIIRAQKRKEQITREIVVKTERIDFQKTKLVVNDLSKIQKTIENLNHRLPSLQEEVERINYQCYNLSPISAVPQESIMVFIINNKDFNNYIKESYGVEPPNIFSFSAPVRITTVSILSTIWQEQFGKPFNSQQIKQTRQFSFNHDFNCLNSTQTSVVTGYGIIKSIKPKNILVQVEGKEFTLNLGACTRLQSVQRLPRQGQTIYFKGNMAQNQQINIYKASCI